MNNTIDSGGPNHVRNGVGSVRAYVFGPLGIWSLVESAFGAEVVEKHELSPEAFHMEVRIGDSALVLELADPPHPSGFPGSIYVYVPDVDGSYERALAAGAESISAPEDKPYEERQCGVRDVFGNVWWIATAL